MFEIKKIFLILICLLPMVSWGQEQQQTKPYQFDLDKADLAYRSKKYNTAALLFQKVYPKIKEEEEKQQVLFKIADSYRYSNNFKQALKWYEEVLNSKYPDPAVLYSYGQLLKNFERYDEASRAFYDYSFEVPEDKQGKLAQQSCAVAADWKANPLKFKVENITALNTDQSDYAPYYSNGKLVFTSTRKEAQGSETFEWTGQKYSDLFESKLTGGSYSKPAALKALNSNYNEGVAWFDTSFTSVYFTQCNGVDGKGINCKIYVSYFQNGAWIEPKPLPFNSDSFSTGHPTFTADGKRMYFTSDMKGGYGKKDLWYMTYDQVKDAWGNPVNLGAGVNSEDDEMFPYVDEKGLIFYASKGKIGMGGLDLFETSDSAGTFKVGRNLQYPINSGGDDFSISFLPESKRTKDAPYAFFTSNREGGVGDDDLYSLADKPVVVLLKGLVYDRESGQPIAGAGVKLINSTAKILSEPKTNEKGLVTIDIPLNELLFLTAAKDKYLTGASIEIDSRNVLKDTVIEVKIPLDLVPATDIEITMQGIYYDLDKWDVRPDAKVVLDSLAGILKNNPSLVIELASHTDSRAPAEYNLELSKKRAQSCVSYLTQKGIAKDRMLPVGYGETKLVNDCSDDVDCSEAEHQQNRRTTVRVIKTDYKPRR
jgi:outer membrane protein OmpA-like peptidoglycan-associated protein/tetratricopeptide (TPR) repeat protein